MTVFLIFVFLCLFTGFAIATGIFVIVVSEESLRTILAYLFFLAVLAVPTLGKSSPTTFG